MAKSKVKVQQEQFNTLDLIDDLNMYVRAPILTVYSALSSGQADHGALQDTLYVAIERFETDIEKLSASL